MIMVKYFWIHLPQMLILALIKQDFHFYFIINDVLNFYHWRTAAVTHKVGVYPNCLVLWHQSLPIVKPNWYVTYVSTWNHAPLPPNPLLPGILIFCLQIVSSKAWKHGMSHQTSVTQHKGNRVWLAEQPESGGGCIQFSPHPVSHGCTHVLLWLTAWT